MILLYIFAALVVTGWLLLLWQAISEPDPFADGSFMKSDGVKHV